MAGRQTGRKKRIEEGREERKTIEGSGQNIGHAAQCWGHSTIF